MGVLCRADARLRARSCVCKSRLKSTTMNATSFLRSVTSVSPRRSPSGSSLQTLSSLMPSRRRRVDVDKRVGAQVRAHARWRSMAPASGRRAVDDLGPMAASVGAICGSRKLISTRTRSPRRGPAQAILDQVIRSPGPRPRGSTSRMQCRAAHSGAIRPLDPSEQVAAEQTLALAAAPPGRRSIARQNSTSPFAPVDAGRWRSRHRRGTTSVTRGSRQLRGRVEPAVQRTPSRRGAAAVHVRLVPLRSLSSQTAAVPDAGQRVDRTPIAAAEPQPSEPPNRCPSQSIHSSS